MVPGPQVDVSGLPPSGDGFQGLGCKRARSSLEPIPLPPSNSELPTFLVLDPRPLPHLEGLPDSQSPAPSPRPPPAPRVARRRVALGSPPPRAHTQLILGGCCLDKMRWERSRLRGRSHLARVCSLRVCPACFGPSSTFEKPRFRFWPKRPCSRGDPGAGERPAVLHPNNFLSPLPGGLFPSCLLSPSTSLVFPQPGWEGAPPLGDALREAAGRTRAPRSLPDAGGWR